MSEQWVKIEVNGKPLEARKGAMLIEVTDAADIRIPRFCYHPKLSIAANCRMCLVEVEKAPKPLPACATPVADGMKVWTHSAKALDAQRGTMEFLLINHPLDCPICDQGGECELQDVAMGYGAGISRFAEGKRAVKDKDVGPLIRTEMTRCIHCTRCVRFGDEIAGLRELGATGRGEHMEIGTYIEKSIVSELSGNVIDLCPVGALVARPSRHSGRSWEYIQHAMIGPHDAVGSNLFVHTIRGRVKRVVPRANEAVNETWIADRDRFSYEGLHSPDRALRPWQRERGDLEWDEALDAARDGLRRVIDRHGADAVGVLISPSATLEECYLAQKLARGLGIAHIDHRLRQADCGDPEADPVFPWLGQSLEELERVDAALLIGSNVRMEQPLAGNRLRKAALGGAELMFINPRDFDFRFPVAHKIIADPVGMVEALAALAKAVSSARKAEIPKPLQQVVDAAPEHETARAMAERLLGEGNRSLLLGSQAFAHPQFGLLRALAVFIAGAGDIALGYLPDGANAGGAWLAGAVPHRGPGGQPVEAPGLDARGMLTEPRRAYLLIGGVEPDYDCREAAGALEAVRGAEFVLALSPFADDRLRDYAHLVLPTAAFAETAGTYVNAEGRWQTFQGACKPPGEARPGWKVLRVLGNAFDLPGFDQSDARQVLGEVQLACAELQPDNLRASDAAHAEVKLNGLWRCGDVPIYAVDALVRRAPALQRTPLAEAARVRLSAATARRAGVHNAARAELRQNGYAVQLPLELDESVPEHVVWVSAALADSVALGPMVGPVELGAA
ncbi:MAG: NADH-quinone oxidoreductase subunit NuoG [Candidatus Competibacterales bacterium]|nr:NADH-quinone oxidoreductase subunit NuoG [Candidatus Competibacterales bacterium]